MGWFFIVVGAIVGIGLTVYGTIYAKEKFDTWAAIIGGAMLGNLFQWIGIMENIIQAGK